MAAFAPGYQPLLFGAGSQDQGGQINVADQKRSMMLLEIITFIQPYSSLTIIDWLVLLIVSLLGLLLVGFIGLWLIRKLFAREEPLEIYRLTVPKYNKK